MTAVSHEYQPLLEYARQLERELASVKAAGNQMLTDYQTTAVNFNALREGVKKLANRKDGESVFIYELRALLK